MLSNVVMRRLLLLLLMAWGISGPLEAHSQRLFVNGGAHLASQSVQSQLAGTNPAIQGGIQFQFSEYFRFRTAVTHQNLLSVDGLFQFYFLGEGNNVDPFVTAGYGYYLSGQGEQGLIPSGLGIEYDILNSLSLTFEVNGRFGVNRVVNGQRVELNVVSGLMPGIGISYKPKRIERTAPGPTPVEEENSPIPDEEFSSRSPDRGVDSPFEDPTAGSQESIQKFDLPYTRDSLKNQDPLIVEKGSAPYEDPGEVPVSGEVVVSDDGTMVRLPDGSFIMGLTDEDPYDIQNAGRKQVTVSSFYMDRFEVTNAEYRKFLSSLSGQAKQERRPDSTAWEEAASRANWETYFHGSEREEYPVVAVTWQDAKEYCEWDGKRLPTEAEWEYGARAGRVGGIYPWAGFSPRDTQGRYLANYNPGRNGQAADGYAFTAPVGSYPPNQWGLHDVAGNVAEWVEDAYTPTYSQLSGLDPVNRDPEENRRVVRGGSWSSSAFEIGVGVRNYQPKDEGSARIGFRCAADISDIEGTQQGQEQPSTPPSRQESVQEDPPSQQGSDEEGGF